MRNNFRFKAVVAVILAGLIVFVIFVFLPKKETTVDNNSQQNTVPVATKEMIQGQSSDLSTKKIVSGNSSYKDGSYSATGSYGSPAGTESVKVTLALKNGIIESADVVGEANDHTSKRYQDMFISNYKQYVVGKNIDSVNLDKISGSSLTPVGFNNAVAKIRTEAQA